MKQLLLFIFLSLSIHVTAQTFLAENVVLSTTDGLEYSASIEINEAEVTLTLVGPADRWLGLGFGVNGMTAGGDVVIYDGTNLTDRSFVGGFVQPQLDEVQNWTIQSDEVNGSQRTLVASRAANAGSENFVFENNGESIPLVWARGNGSTFTIANHGGGNRGMAVADFENLSSTTFNQLEWSFAPNPTQGKITLQLPQEFLGEKIEIYTMQGKRIYAESVQLLQQELDLHQFNAGMYVLRIGNQSFSKKLILK